MDIGGFVLCAVGGLLIGAGLAWPYARREGRRDGVRETFHEMMQQRLDDAEKAVRNHG